MTLEATCIHCGTDRPRAAAVCPRCGNPWIDRPLVDEPSTVGPTQYVPPPLPERRTGAGFLRTTAMVVGVALLLFGLFDVGRRLLDSDATTASPPTTSAPVAATTTPPATDPPPTTSPPPQSTTIAPTTTTSVPQLGLPPPGDAVALSDLGLGAFALGVLDFDDPADDVIATLLATFGPADTYEEISAGYGLCGAGSIARWGPLTAVFDEGRFVAYRLEGGQPEHEASDLATLSGARLGDDMERLEAIYARFDTQVTDARYTVNRQSDGRILLWGPVVDGAVGGIYSANPCDAGTD